jgi:FkbH-like protein
MLSRLPFNQIGTIFTISANMTHARHILNSEKAIAKADQQQYLCKSIPKRTELLKLKSEWLCSEILIRVHRNHSFEYIASVIDPFLGYAGYRAEFSYSDYDDSLSFADCQDNAVSVEIIWLDYDRYFSSTSSQDLDFFISWLDQRISELRKISKAPILINDWPCLDSYNQLASEYNLMLSELIKDKPGVRICCQKEILDQLGERFFDNRSAKLTGTTWSDKACLLNARKLAWQWISASLSPRLKAIVLDLDLTLYQGVLGEDGVTGVVLTDLHLHLQQELLKLKESGIFLAIASRNERTDVEELFRQRIDFPLKLTDFAAIEVNWQAKSANILKIADHLRISPDAMLFVDDNPGEIAKVSEDLSTIWTLLASCQIPTVDVLKLYPRLWAWEQTATDNLRLADLQAASVRNSLVTKSQSIEAYWQALQVELDIHFNPVSQLVRLCELSQKTNQFNLNLSRINEVEMADYLASTDWIVISIHLRDRLSDSGIVALIVGERVGKILTIHEICISCRALGRQLEDIMIAYTLDRAIESFLIETVRFKYQTASRNSPALDWLAQFTKVGLTDANLEIVLASQDLPQIDPVHLSALNINTYDNSPSI